MSSNKKMTEAARAQKTLNAVRSMMSESAQADVPVLAEGDDISKFANPILNYKAHTNEFISVLVDRIMFTAVEVKRYSNRLARLKKGRPYPLGTDVQQIYENPVNPMGYNGENLSGILKLYKGDTKVAYYTRNRQDVFPLSINREELMGAFVSYEKFNRFVSAKINSVFPEMKFASSICSSRPLLTLIQTILFLAAKWQCPPRKMKRKIW